MNLPLATSAQTAADVQRRSVDFISPPQAEGTAGRRIALLDDADTLVVADGQQLAKPSLLTPPTCGNNAAHLGPFTAPAPPTRLPDFDSPEDWKDAASIFEHTKQDMIASGVCRRILTTHNRDVAEGAMQELMRHNMLLTGCVEADAGALLRAFANELEYIQERVAQSMQKPTEPLVAALNNLVYSLLGEHDSADQLRVHLVGAIARAQSQTHAQPTPVATSRGTFSVGVGLEASALVEILTVLQKFAQKDELAEQLLGTPSTMPQRQGFFSPVRGFLGLAFSAALMGAVYVAPRALAPANGWVSAYR